MTPTFVVLHIYKGQTFRKTLVFTDADGAPLDLSLHSARMHVREQIGSTVPVMDLGTADNTITLSAQGELSFNVSDVDTSSLPTGHEVLSDWVYDLEWTSPDGTVERPLYGVVVVWPEVTR